METLLNIAVEMLRLVPVILALYIPALIGVVIWKERGEGYRMRAILAFVLGFGAIISVLLVFGTGSALQMAVTLGLALVQGAVALFLAALTVYKLAD